MTEKVGSLSYMAPEVVQRHAYDQKCDVWSACVLLFILLSGEQPFFGEDKKKIQEAITLKDLHFPKRHWQKLSIEAREFIRLGLIKYPDIRPSSDDMLGHIWLSGET